MVRGRTRAAEPEGVEDNGLNLKALKEKKISDLALIGKNFNIEGAANMRKQELIFAILQAQTEQNGHIYGEGVLETLPDGFGFLRAPITITFPGQMISMFLRVRFAALVFEPAISSPDTFGHPKWGSAILPYLRLNQLTMRTPRELEKRSFLIILPLFIPTNGYASNTSPQITQLASSIC